MPSQEVPIVGSTGLVSIDSGPTSASACRLPPEVWADVFLRILPDHDSDERPYALASPLDGRETGPANGFLQNVSLTCWLFHDLALPIRFKSVELRTHPQPTPNILFNRLSTSQSLRNFVKVIHLSIHPDDDGPLPESTQAILCGMPNLQDIWINSGFQITPRIYTHFCSLDSLIRLQIDSHISFPTTQMTTTTPDDQDDDALIQPMTVDPTTPSAHLNTLHVVAPGTSSEMEEFKVFVRHTPLITALKLEISPLSPHMDALDSRYMEGDPSFPSELLPALRPFEGHIKEAVWFVPGRPVEEIVVTTFPWAVRVKNHNDNFDQLALSTAAVRCFSVVSIYGAIPFSQIVELFPDLEELRTIALELDFETYSKSWLERGFVSDVSRLRRLRTLTVTVHGCTDATEEKALLKLPPIHPLERVCFSLCGHNDWYCKCSRRVWRKSERRWVKS